MAASDARPVPQKNVAYRVSFPILDADGDPVTAATALDSEVSKDGGTFADCTSEATEIATSSGIYFLDLTATEMNADTVAIQVKTTSSGAKTTVIVLYPEEAGDIRVNATQWNSLTTVALPLVPATAGRTLVVDAAGLADANVVKVGPTGAGSAQTARDIGASVLLSSGTGTGQLDFTAGITKANVTQLLGTAWLTPGTAGTPDVNTKLWNGLTTVALPLIPTTAGRTLDVSIGGEAGLDWANIGSPTTVVVLSGTTVSAVSTVNGLAANVITAAATASDFGTELATALWTDTTAGDFTVALSVGKSLMNGVALGTGLTVARATLVDTLTTYTGNTVQTGDAFARIGATGSGLTSLAPSSTALSTAVWTTSLATNIGTTNSTVFTNLDVIVSSRGTSTLTQTQVTGGAYSIQSAFAVLGDARIANLDTTVSSRSTFAGGAVASVTGNVGGNVVGSVNSVATAITLPTIPTGWITADGIATDAIGALELAAGAASEIATAVRTELTTELGRIDVASSTLATQISVNDLPTNAELATALTTTVTIVGVNAATANKLADHARRRSQANVEASSDGDALSLGSEYGCIQQAQEANYTTGVVKRTDGTTTLGTLTLATSAGADPIRSVS